LYILLCFGGLTNLSHDRPRLAQVIPDDADGYRDALLIDVRVNSLPEASKRERKRSIKPHTALHIVLQLLRQGNYQFDGSQRNKQRLISRGRGKR